MKPSEIKLSVLALAGVVVLTQTNPGWAFKNLLKNVVSPDAAVSGEAKPGDAKAEPKKPSGPVAYLNEKYGYKLEVPGQWEQMGGDPKSNTAMFFDNGDKGSFQVNANWMAEDFPVQSSLNAMEKQYQERVKHGELKKYFRKDVTVADPSGKKVVAFQGFVTVETAEDSDPDIMRMQWIGYGKGNYYNFTWAAAPQQFDKYAPVFDEILNKIEFKQQ